MLRIKADRLKDFCEKAKGFGFRKSELHFIADSQYTCEGIIVTFGGEISHFSDYGDSEALDLLHDLITLGYVEKI